MKSTAEQALTQSVQEQARDERGLDASGPVPPLKGEPSAIGRGLTLLFAVATGLAVANLYYAQPLLHLIAHDLHTGVGPAGLLITVSQVGYAAGLLLIVPAGDLVNRRVLICGLLGACSVALVGAALSPSLAVLAIACAAVGFTSVAVQVLIPLAASLASDEKRGQVLGTVMSGLLMGILLARTVAGLIAGAFGWRVLYALAAGAMIALASVLARSLPNDSERPVSDYRSLLRSVLTLVGRYRQLRIRSVYGALGFAAFSVFWTTAAFLLSGPPYHYSTTVIGLFGLIGAAGALTASGAGRLADSGQKQWATGLFVLAIAVSFGLLWLGRDSLGALIAGIIVLDVGVQGLHVLNQHTIYQLEPEARSRLNSAYMTSYFVGGASGSALASTLYSADGWGAVCILGALIGAVALGVWLLVDR